jgi:alkylation response protein AidB-like acyl-CoA dehydrogenase
MLYAEQVNDNTEELIHNLGSVFSDRAQNYDQEGQFVSQNYRELKDARFFSLAIPAELGGGNLSYDSICYTIRQLARYCGSTALAFAMHTHPVALNVFKFKKTGDSKAKATLAKIAANELIIAGTGANDWLASNGTAEKVAGGYRINAHKRFVSGGPSAQVMVSSVNHQTQDGAEVLHFSLPFSSDGIKIQNNWNTLGMRGTGSNDVILDNVFLPDEAVVARRPAGQWHVLWDTILPIALPIIVSVYVGMAEQACELAVKSAANKPELSSLLGAMHNHLVSAQLALDDMIRRNQSYGFVPGTENTNAILTRKTLAANAVKQAVETAAIIVGGSGFFKGHPLEIIIRDIRAMHFHPLPEHKQFEFSGRTLLDLNPIH